MLAYIARRLLLMIPTVFGIMLVSFAIVQFVPGGPVERAIAQLQGGETSSTAEFRRRRRDRRGRGRACRRRHFLALSRRAGARPQIHQGTGEAIRLRQAGDRAVLDPGSRLFHLQPRHELLPQHAGTAADQGEAAGLDVARAVDDADLLRDLDPARRRQGGARRLALRYLDLGRSDLRLCDSELPVRDPAGRAVLRRLVLADFSAPRPDLGQFRRSRLAAQDPRLSLAHHVAGDARWCSARSRPRRC